jgi:hypothetical protein
MTSIRHQVGLKRIGHQERLHCFGCSADVLDPHVEVERYHPQDNTPPVGANQEYDRANAQALFVQFVPQNIRNLIIRTKAHLAKFELYELEEDESDEEEEQKQQQEDEPPQPEEEVGEGVDEDLEEEVEVEEEAEEEANDELDG